MDDKKEIKNLSERYISFYEEGLFDDHLFRNNVGLLIDYRTLRDYINLYEYYKMVLDVPGVVVEFGCRYGRMTCTALNLRNYLEPENITRKFIAFDTFDGFPNTSEKDSNEYNKELSDTKVGEFGIGSQNYSLILHQILSVFSATAGYSAKQNIDLIKGDASKTAPEYFKEFKMPVALAYFDFDLYKPTKVCLEQIWPLMNKGGVIVFDQYSYQKWPGETEAVSEFFKDKGKQRIRRLPHSQLGAYIVVE